MGATIAVRADAGAAIGLGHAMRCLALAQALADEGGRAVFLMAEPPAAFAARLADEGLEVVALRAPPGGPEDAAETAALAESARAAWVVVDGYGFDGRYEGALVDAGRRVLALDDHGHTEHRAQLVLNQNLGAAAPAAEHALVGPRFALLRREFRTWDAARPPVPAIARRVLVTLGGSDPEGVSLRVLEGLEGIAGPLEVQLLAGALNPRRAELERAVERSRHAVELVAHADDMARRMAWADLAVSAAGSSSWELARVGTPQVAIVVADNQRPVGRALGEHGIAVALGWHADVAPPRIGAAVGALAREPQRRAAMARRGPELIDGQGAVRVLGAMGLASTMPPDGHSVRKTVARRG